MEEQAQEVALDKDKSLKVTKATNFGTSIGDLRVYNDDLTPRDYDSYPKITITAAEDLGKFQYGIIKITVQNMEYSPKMEYLVQVDGLMSIVYSVYAKTLNDLRAEKFREKTIRMWGILKMSVFRIKRLFGK